MNGPQCNDHCLMVVAIRDLDTGDMAVELRIDCPSKICKSHTVGKMDASMARELGEKLITASMMALGADTTERAEP